MMEENLDVRDVLAALRRRWRLIAQIFAASMLAAVLFLLVVTPKFTSEATLKFNPTRFEINVQKTTVGSELFDRLVAGEIAAIESPEVLMKVLKSEELLNDPELNRKTIMEMAAGAVNALLGSEQAPVSHELQILERFKKKLFVTHPDRTNLIMIAYRSEDAEKSAKVANAVANIFLAQHFEGRLATPLATKWLNDRKESLRERWRKSEDSVERFKAENNLSYVSGDKLREQQVDRLNEQLVLAKTQTEAARARVEQVRGLLNSRDHQQLANAVRSDVLTRLRDRLAAASQREASLGSTLLPSHPQLRQARAEVASLRTDIESEGRRLLAKLEVEFNSAREQEALIRKNFDRTIHDIQDSGAALVKLRELERTAASNRAIYETFLNRSNETLEQSTGDFANFNLIKSAQVPIKPSFPSKIKVFLLAIFGSLVAGAGLALILEASSNTFRSRADVTETLNLPVLATLPYMNGASLNGSKPGRRQERTMAHHLGAPFAQNLPALWLGLDMAGETEPVKMLAVTSAANLEGKTMAAVALAQEAASHGARVLLIDCNWRRPKLGWLFDAPVRGRAAANGGASSLIIRDPQSGLDVLPAMAGAGTPAGFAGSREFADLLASARDTYDLVVLDTGAVLTDTESCVLASAADAALFVVRWDKTPRDRARQAVELLESWNARVFGTVLNAADFRHMARAGESISARAVEERWPAGKGAYGRRRRARGAGLPAETPAAGGISGRGAAI